MTQWFERPFVGRWNAFYNSHIQHVRSRQNMPTIPFGKKKKEAKLEKVWHFLVGRAWTSCFCGAIESWTTFFYQFRFTGSDFTVKKSLIYSLIKFQKPFFSSRAPRALISQMFEKLSRRFSVGTLFITPSLITNICSTCRVIKVQVFIKAGSRKQQFRVRSRFCAINTSSSCVVPKN